jgi:hypothetical protein
MTTEHVHCGHNVEQLLQLQQRPHRLRLHIPATALHIGTGVAGHELGNSVATEDSIFSICGLSVGGSLMAGLEVDAQEPAGRLERDIASACAHPGASAPG